jgi:hypothetical protein
MVATVLQQCNVTDSIYSYSDWYVAVVIFGYLSLWLLLVVVVFTLNTMLQKQLGHSNSILKILLLAIIGVMGLLTVALAALTAYLNYERPRSYYDSYYGDYSDLSAIVDATTKLRTAYFALYLLSLLASGGLALTSMLSLRRESKAAARLIGWLIVLTAAMLLWVIIALIYSSWDLRNIYYSVETSIAMSYIQSFGQAVACIIILCIAKHACWGSQITANPMTGTDTYAPVTYPQPYANTNNQTHQPPAQYAYNGNPNGQTYQYNQTPELVGTTHPIR